MDKYTYVGKKERKEFFTKYGIIDHGNVAPPNFRRISQLQAVRETRWGSYSPKYTEHRQILRDEFGKKFDKMIPVQLIYFWDGTGVGIQKQYWDKENPIQFWAFGCTHDYRELRKKECSERGIYHAGICYHVCECNKCGHIWSYDSSD